MYRTASYTAPELKKKYPSLAKAVEELLDTAESNTPLYALKIEYSGRYKRQGKTRKAPLGRIIEALEDNGYEIEITVKPPKK